MESLVILIFITSVSPPMKKRVIVLVKRKRAKHPAKLDKCTIMRTHIDDARIFKTRTLVFLKKTIEVNNVITIVNIMIDTNFDPKIVKTFDEVK